MAQLIVRKLKKSVVLKLKRRAAQHGISTEEEHRRILREILEPKEKPKPKLSFKEYLLTMPNVGEDSDFEMPRNDKPREVDLSD
jgi:plasmid stability protein